MASNSETQSILYQRFLESDGEMGRNFTKAYTRFTDLHQAIATAVPTTVVEDAAATTTTAPPAAVPAAAAAAPALELLESLLRELDAYDYSMQHAKLVQENAMVEMANYQTKEAEIADRILSTQSSLLTLQTDLSAARARRVELEEYESLTKRLLTLPSRNDSTNEIGRLHQLEATLLADHTALVADLRVKHKKFSDVLLSMELMSTEWTVEDAMAQKVAADEAAIEMARAAEEAAMREAALEAKLALEQETGQEQDQEQDQDADRDQDHIEQDEPSQSDDVDGDGVGKKSSGAVDGSLVAPLSSSDSLVEEGETSLDDSPTPIHARATSDNNPTQTTTTPTPDETEPMEQ